MQEFKLVGKRGNGLLVVLALGVVGVIAVLLFSSFGVQQDCNAPGSTCAPAIPTSSGVVSQGEAQEVYLRALETGLYDKQKITVDAGKPVRIHFSADDKSGCGKALIIRDFGVALVSRNGEVQVAEFTPTPGKYEYSCSMRMFRGTLEAV